MDDEPWHIRRRRELEAAAPVKRKKVEPFVKVPLWWIEQAAKCAKSPATIILIELLRVSWKTGTPTVSLPNGRLKGLGVTRDVKRRVLDNLERNGMIRIERQPRKAPVITLIGL